MKFKVIKRTRKFVMGSEVTKVSDYCCDTMKFMEEPSSKWMYCPFCGEALLWEIIEEEV